MSPKGLSLVLLYVNDIGDNLKSPHKLFADDCIVYKEIKERQDCEILQRYSNPIQMDTRLAIEPEHL